MHDCESLEEEIPSREHDILPTWKYTPDRFECLTSHDDRMPLRRSSEVYEVLWNVPWDLSLISDDAIASHSSDGDILGFLHG